MNSKAFWESVSIFETGLSAAEWVWRIVTIVIVGGSGTLTALMARADPLLGKMGPIYWVIVGVITALIVALIMFLVKMAAFKQAEADFRRAMSVPRNTVNPLLESFKDSIISVEDLRLPIVQLHENKHFKRCKFVGPAAIAILGGTYVYNGFLDCGDIIALPPESVALVGIVILKNCTVEECEFIRTTVFTDQNSARAFATIPGVRVKGLMPIPGSATASAPDSASENVGSV